MPSHKKRGGFFGFFKKKSVKEEIKTTPLTRAPSITKKDPKKPKGNANHHDKTNSTKMKTEKQKDEGKTTLSKHTDEGRKSIETTTTRVDESNHQNGQNTELNKDIQDSSAKNRNIRSSNETKQGNDSMTTTESKKGDMSKASISNNNNGNQNEVTEEAKIISANSTITQQNKPNAQDNDDIQFEKPPRYSPIPSDPSVTSYATSDNQSDTAIVVNTKDTSPQRINQSMQKTTTINVEDSYPIQDITRSMRKNNGNNFYDDLNERRDSRTTADDARPLHAEGVTDYEFNESIMYSATESQKSKSLWNLSNSATSSTKANKAIAIDRNKNYRMDIIHYAPDNTTFEEKRNVRSGSLSRPPPQKSKNERPNFIITSSEGQKPSVKEQQFDSTRRQHVINNQNITDNSNDQLDSNHLQKEYSKLRNLFDKWHSHCADPMIAKNVYTIKLQAEMVAQLERVRKLCAEAPAGDVANSISRTIPLLSQKKRPELTNYKFVPPTPLSPSSSQTSSRLTSSTQQNSSQTDTGQNNNKSVVKNTPFGHARQTTITPQMNVVKSTAVTASSSNEQQKVQRNDCKNSNRSEASSIDIINKPVYNTISYRTTVQPKQNQPIYSNIKQTTAVGTNQANAKVWSKRKIECEKIDEKVWVTSTLRGESALSLKNQERQKERDSAYQRIRHEIELEVERQRELKKMRQQSNKLPEVDEKLDDGHRSSESAMKVKDEKSKNSVQLSSSNFRSAESTRKNLAMKSSVNDKLVTAASPPLSSSTSQYSYKTTTTKKDYPTIKTINNDKVNGYQNNDNNNNRSEPSNDRNEKTLPKQTSVSEISKYFGEKLTTSKRDESPKPFTKSASTHTIKQVLQNVKAETHSTNIHSNIENPPQSQNHNHSSVMHQHPTNMNDSSAPLTTRKNNNNNQSSIHQSINKKLKNEKNNDDEDHNDDKNSGDTDTQQPITNSIRSVISSVKNTHSTTMEYSNQMNNLDRPSHLIANNIEQSFQHIDKNERNQQQQQQQFTIPKLKKVGTPVERVGIQLGFVREDSPSDKTNGILPGENSSRQQNSRYSSMSSITTDLDESSTPQITISKSGPPPPPPGPAPVISQLHSLRTSASPQSPSDHAASSNLPTPSSTNDKMRRLHQSVSPLSNFDPTALIAEMKRVQLKSTSNSSAPTTARQSASNDPRESLLKEICDAGGIKYLKKAATPT